MKQNYIYKFLRGLFLIVILISLGLAVATPKTSGLESSKIGGSVESPNSDRLYARIVLFIPETAEAPKDYQERLVSVATKTESFFAKWMKYWKRDIGRTKIFARNENRMIQITLVKGNLQGKTGRNALLLVRKQAIDGAIEQLRLEKGSKSVWWVFYDDPEVRGFRGRGNTSGGVAINAYPKGTGALDQDLELASPLLVTAKIKGAIHEFGHALGLPHIGPRLALKLGNSLMGPVNRVFFRKTDSRNPLVHLNEASAAALWKHPVFQVKSVQPPKTLRQVKVSDLKIVDHKNGKKIVVSGILKSNRVAHSAIILNSKRPRFGDYWGRAYLGAIMNGGRFEVVVYKPFEGGKLYLTFCFEDGVNTADGKKQLIRRSVIEVPYP